MNIFTRNRIIVGIAILLTAINLAILGTFGFYHTRKQEYEPQQNVNSQRNPRKMIAREIDLTQEQEGKFETLHKDFVEETRENKAALLDQYNMIMRELDEKNPDRNRLDSLAREIGRLHFEQQQTTIEHFLSLREVCSPEQFKSMQRMFRRNMSNGSRHREMEQRRQRSERRRNSPLKNQ